MKKTCVILFALLLTSCKETPTQFQQPLSSIVAHVYWQDQGLADKQIVLVQTAETLRTDSKGFAEFSVPAGHYIIRAFGINGPGPAPRSIDFDVQTYPGKTTRVDILDCLECLYAIALPSHKN